MAQDPTYRTFTGVLDATGLIRYLRSIDVAENAGTPGLAKVLVRDGNAGNLVLPISIAASDSKHLRFNPPLFFPNGVYVDVGLGTVRGTIDGD